MAKNPFNTEEPLAYLITWTTYGTWLPGDERGWKRKGESDLQSPDALAYDAAQLRMKEPKFRLSRQQRVIVEATIRDHCTIRKWTLHTVNARSNHVHVVVTAPNYDPEIVRDQFKAWCTRKLREAGYKRDNFWTEKGSCRSINTEDDLESAVLYVAEAQDRKGREWNPQPLKSQ